MNQSSSPTATSNTADESPRLRVAVEATSMLGARSGVGIMATALVQRLAAYPGLELTALAVTWRGRKDLAPLLPLGVALHTTRTPARLAHLLWQRVEYPAVRGFDVVHGPNFVVPPVGRSWPWAGRSARSGSERTQPVRGAQLVTVHDLGPWHFPHLVDRHSRAYPRLLARAVARGAHVHTVSRFVADEVMEATGIGAERVHVIANGFDPPPIPEPLAAPTNPEADSWPVGGRPYVLALGTIEPRKDLPTLVQAMADVWRHHPDLCLVVAGQRGWGADAFDEACRRVHAGDRVSVLGYVSSDERERLLRGAQCLAFPSIYEGFGLPPLEAMARGLPVVATTAGAVPEVCGDGAALVPPQDPAALAEALLSVVGDDQRAQSLIAAGHRRVKVFSWNTMASEMAALYRRLATR